MSLAGAGFLAAAVVVGMQALLIPLLRRVRVVDMPGARSSHTAPTPRGGGLGALAGLAAGVVVSGFGEAVPWTVAAGIGLAALVGLVDDLRGLSPQTRLALQVVAAVLVTWSFGWSLAVAMGGVLAVVAYVNAFNFMDGINGISAVTLAVCGLQFLLVGQGRDELLVVVGAVTVGSALGFLPFNAPRARIFLGDVGSYGLGALLAWAFLHALSVGVPWTHVAAGAAVYLADTGSTLVRRLLGRRSIFAAHREHTYQRILQRGWPHIAVSGLVGAVTLAVLAAVGVGWSGQPSALGAVVGAAVVAGYLLLPVLLTASSQVATATSWEARK